MSRNSLRGRLMGSTKAHSVTDSTIPPTVCKLSSWQLKKKGWLSVPFSFCWRLSPTTAMTNTGNRRLVRGSTNPTRSRWTMSSIACRKVASRPCCNGKKMAMIHDFKKEWKALIVLPDQSLYYPQCRCIPSTFFYFPLWSREWGCNKTGLFFQRLLKDDLELFWSEISVHLQTPWINLAMSITKK